MIIYFDLTAVFYKIKLSFRSIPKYIHSILVTLISVQNCLKFFICCKIINQKKHSLLNNIYYTYVAMYESESEPFIFPDLNNFSLLINFSCLPLRGKIAEGYSNRDFREILHAHIAELLYLFSVFWAANKSLF